MMVIQSDAETVLLRLPAPRPPSGYLTDRVEFIQFTIIVRFIEWLSEFAVPVTVTV